MGREIRLIRALADEGYQYGLNDGVPPIPRDRMVALHVAAEASRPAAHGRDRGRRHPGDHAARRGPDEPGRRPRLRPARAGDRRGARRRAPRGRRATTTGARPTAWRDAFAASTASTRARAVRALLQRDDRRRGARRRRGRRARSGTGSSSCSASGRTTTTRPPTRSPGRVAELRIFRDDEGRTNRSLLDVGGAALVVSPVHALRRHAPRAPARLHGRRGARAGRAALPAVRGRARGHWASRSRRAGSGPRWRSSSSTTARSRSGSTPPSVEPRFGRSHHRGSAPPRHRAWRRSRSSVDLLTGDSPEIVRRTRSPTRSVPWVVIAFVAGIVADAADRPARGRVRWR